MQFSTSKKLHLKKGEKIKILYKLSSYEVNLKRYLKKNAAVVYYYSIDNTTLTHCFSNHFIRMSQVNHKLQTAPIFILSF